MRAKKCERAFLSHRGRQISWGVAASARAMAWARRFQLAVSSPSRFRPAVVSRKTVQAHGAASNLLAWHTVAHSRRSGT